MAQLRLVQSAIEGGDLRLAQTETQQLLPLLMSDREDELVDLKAKVDALKASVQNTHTQFSQNLVSARRKRSGCGAYQDVQRA